MLWTIHPLSIPSSSLIYEVAWLFNHVSNLIQALICTLHRNRVYKERALSNSPLTEDCTSTAHKMKFSVKDFFSKCDQIRKFLQTWSLVLKKSLMENFIFVQCGVNWTSYHIWYHISHIKIPGKDVCVNLECLYFCRL